MKLNRRLKRLWGNITGERQRQLRLRKIARIDRQLDAMVAEAESQYKSATDPAQKLLWLNTLCYMRTRRTIDRHRRARI